MALNEFNQKVKDTIDSYYKTRSADDFFTIDYLLNTAMKYNMTPLEVPQLIEMKNIIVMG